MLNKVLLCGTRHSAIRCLIRKSSHSSGIPEKYQKFRPGTMDEFPLPEGDWKEAYNKLQSKYNKQLAAGLAIFSLTMVYIFTAGPIDLVLPPPMKNE